MIGGQPYNRLGISLNFPPLRDRGTHSRGVPCDKCHPPRSGLKMSGGGREEGGRKREIPSNYYDR